MSEPSSPKPPSAIDGYRRLARTRAIAATQAAAGPEAVVPMASGSRRRRRIAGSLRMAAFAAVLAIIIGTSVGLASADTRGSSGTDAERAAATPVTAKPHLVTKLATAKTTPTPAATPIKAKTSATRPKDVEAAPADAKASPAPTPVADTTTAPAAAAAAPVNRSRDLPFTGTPAIDRILLAGASLVLLGMLVQIGGQPLPAHAGAARGSRRPR